MSTPAKLKRAEFLAELGAFAAKTRQLIESECDGFPVDDAARKQRVAKARKDFRYFCYTYFPHYVSGEPSEFQTWVYEQFPKRIDNLRGTKTCVSAPRGEAKSTLLTQLGTIWCVVTGRKRFVPIIMDSFDQAATMLEAIKIELTDNPRLAMDWPDETGKGRVWNVRCALTAKNCKIEAFGIDKRIRGLRHGAYRPDLVFIDDPENDENVQSPEQRDKLESKIMKSILPLGSADGTMDIFYPNTLLHYDSVANRFHRKPSWHSKKFKAIVQWPDRLDLWQRWEEIFLNEKGLEELAEGEERESDLFYRANEAEMLRGSRVSWPSKRPLLMLMQIRAEDRHVFDCEYQNEPTNEDEAYFANLQYWVQPVREWVFYGSHDPSMGRFGKRRDPSATLVGGYDKVRGKLSLAEAIVARRLPALQTAHIIECQKEYLCLGWAFESVQFQEFFRQYIVTASAAAGVHVPAIPVNPSDDKILRIQAISPHVNNGLILFNPAHTVLLEQLRHFPEADHDDGPDALEMLWKLATSGAGGLPKFRTGKRSNGKRSNGSRSSRRHRTTAYRAT